MDLRFCIAMQGLLCLTFAKATKLQCPDHSQWSLRFRAFCPNSTMWYYCVYDKNSQRYKEECSNEESFHKPGFKYIIIGNLNGQPCDNNRFQPFKFSMDGYSECVFLKSTCNDNGQILHNDGTTKTDSTCRCDYTRGYAFVNKPNNTCYCNPTNEDCSCYKKPCGENEVLTADYVCIQKVQWYKNIRCPLIKEKRRIDNSTTGDVQLKHTAVIKPFIGLTGFKELQHTEKLVVLIILISMIAVFSMFVIVRECHQIFLRKVETEIEERIEKRMEERIEKGREERITKNKQVPDDLTQKGVKRLRQKKTKDVHKQHINDWLKDDEKFIETKATHQISEKLKRDGCVLVVAVDGNGKSSIVRHIALKLKEQEKYEIIPIVLSPFTIFEFLNRKQKQIFVVDDLCGKVHINTQSVDVWASQIEAILELVSSADKNEKIRNDIKFLFATGLHIYDDIIFKKNELLMKYVFELSNCPLTDDEKLQMMKKYISKETEIRLSHELKSDEAYFPLLCKIAESKTTNQIISLFDNLEDFIESDLEHLNNSNNLKFCIITLCALFHNKFKEEILSDVYESEIEKQAFENICLECNLGTNKDQVKSKIKDQLRNIEGMYMTKTENYYHFIHSKVYQIAELVCGKIFLYSFIKFVRSAFIAERFSFQSNMTENNKHIVIINNEDEEKRYFDRLMFDLKQGETYSTFHNSQLWSESYRKKFVSYCQTRQQKVRELLKQFSAKSETVVVTSDERDYEDYTEFTKQHHFYSHKMRKPLIESAWEGNADIVELLLEMECSINESDKFGRTALFVACLLGKNEHQEVVNILLESNADHSLCDKNKRSPLLVAAKEGNNFIVKLLLKCNADVDQCDDKGNSPLLVASSDSPLVTIKLLARKSDVSKRNSLGQTPIFIASINGREDVVRYLLSLHNENISTPDNEGRSPLFVACSKGHHDVVKILLENKADISQCDWNNRSPLFIASAAGYADIVLTLIHNKADINQRNEDGETPLYIASDIGHLATVKIIVNNHADLNATNHRKCTPMYAACKRGFIEIVKVLNENRASITQCNKWNSSPLFAACRYGYIEIVRYLVDNGSNISESDFSGTSPLLIACENGNTEIVDILIKSGAEINQPDRRENIPIHASAAEGHIAILKRLINEGADITLTNSDNETPLDLARKHSHTDIVKLLLSSK